MKKANETSFKLKDPRLVGENNPRWNNTIVAGRQRAQRAFVIQPCEICGSEKRINRHHIDGNPLNNVRENIQFLCNRHHSEVEKKLGVRFGRSKTVVSKEELLELHDFLGTWQKVADYLGVTIRTIFSLKKEYV